MVPLLLLRLLCVFVPLSLFYVLWQSVLPAGINTHYFQVDNSLWTKNVVLLFILGEIFFLFVLFLLSTSIEMNKIISSWSDNKIILDVFVFQFETVTTFDHTALCNMHSISLFLVRTAQCHFSLWLRQSRKLFTYSYTYFLYFLHIFWAFILRRWQFFRLSRWCVCIYVQYVP